MVKQSRQSAFQRGTSMIEVLVTLVILLIGLLGLAGLQVRAHEAELESYQRAQALILLQDMVDRLNANRRVHSCYAFTTDAATSTPYLGQGGTVDVAIYDCTAGTPGQQTRAISDIQEWDAALKGASETKSTDLVGSIIGARGCIVREDATNQIYRVSVAWQGKFKTVDPTTVANMETDSSGNVVDISANLTCGKNLYGDEKLRRIVSTHIQIAKLS